MAKWSFTTHLEKQNLSHLQTYPEGLVAEEVDWADYLALYPVLSPLQSLKQAVEVEMIVETPARLQPVVVSVLCCYIQCRHLVHCTDSVDHRWVLSEYRHLDCCWKWDLQGKETLSPITWKIILNFCPKLINMVLNLTALDIKLSVFHKLLATAARCGRGYSCCCSCTCSCCCCSPPSSQAFSYIYCCWWFFFMWPILRRSLEFC